MDLARGFFSLHPDAPISRSGSSTLHTSLITILSGKGLFDLSPLWFLPELKWVVGLIRHIGLVWVFKFKPSDYQKQMGVALNRFGGNFYVPLMRLILCGRRGVGRIV